MIGKTSNLALFMAVIAIFSSCTWGKDPDDAQNPFIVQSDTATVASSDTEPDSFGSSTKMTQPADTESGDEQTESESNPSASTDSTDMLTDNTMTESFDPTESPTHNTESTETNTGPSETDSQSTETTTTDMVECITADYPQCLQDANVLLTCEGGKIVETNCDDAGMVCFEDSCCKPENCEDIGKQCGDWVDECGGTAACGNCEAFEETFYCNEDGHCEDDCAERVCGNGPHGKQCGNCAPSTPHCINDGEDCVECINADETSCRPYKCDIQSHGCLESCSSDGHCQDGYHCDEPECKADLVVGGTCDEPSDCASGNCQNSRCCAAGETCCATPEHCSGTTPICSPSNSHCVSCGSENLCAIQYDGNLPVCAGTGACVECTAQKQDSCGDYVCNTDSNLCYDDCQETNSRCVSGYHCDGSACLLDLEIGDECNEPSDCGSGNCQNEVCCASGETCCTAETHCPESTKSICSPENNHCVSCADIDLCSSQYEQAKPFCDTGSGRCEECVTNDDCRSDDALNPSPLGICTSEKICTCWVESETWSCSNVDDCPDGYYCAQDLSGSMHFSCLRSCNSEDGPVSGLSCEERFAGTANELVWVPTTTCHAFDRFGSSCSSPSACGLSGFSDGACLEYGIDTYFCTYRCSSADDCQATTCGNTWPGFCDQ